MTILSITSKIDLEQVIQGIEKLDNTELERVLSRLSVILTQRKAQSLPTFETDLLDRINQNLPDSIQQRHLFLTTRLQTSTLTDNEHTELIKLIDQIELAEAERMQALIELAGFRAIPLNTLMQQLGIQPPAPQLSHV